MPLSTGTLKNYRYPTKSTTQSGGAMNAVTNPAVAKQAEANWQASTAAAPAILQQIAPLMAAGNYAQAWKIAATAPSAYGTGTANPVVMEALTNPQQIAQMTGTSSMTPAQLSSFYSAALPYAGQISHSPISPSAMTGTDNAYQSPGDVTASLQSLIKNPTEYGNEANIAQAAPQQTGNSDFGTGLMALDAAGLTAATAGALSPAVAGLVGGGVAGGVAGGAAAGTAGSLINSAVTATPPTARSVGTGAVLGGIGGGISAAAQPAAGALSSSTGMTPAESDAVVRGTAGAGVGALGSAISGGNPAAGALIGGASGAASGATQGSTGNAGEAAAAGAGAGIIAGDLASRYLKPSTPTIPSATAAQSTASALPTLPTSTNTPALPTSTNIGSYSGYGYAPRQQVANPVSNYATYGQGPEANFFQPIGSAAAPASPAQPTPNTGQMGTMPVMPSPQSI